MKSKKIIALPLCIVILFSLICFPVHADYINTPQTWWDLLLHRVSNGSTLFGAQGYFNSVAGYFFGAICEASSDGYHHTDSLNGCELGSDEHGQYAVATCQYCGKPFNCYSSDLQQSYDTQVSELPASAYGSNGELRWRLNIDRIKSYEYNGRGSLVSSHVGSEYSVILDTKNCSGPGFVSGYFSKFIVPVTGNYTLYFYCVGDSSYYLSNYASKSDEYYKFIFASSVSHAIYSLSNCSEWTHFSNKGDLTKCDIGANVGLSAGTVLVDEKDYFTIEREAVASLASASGYWELVCTPVTLPGNTYNIDSRPTSITGDYGIIGDNGQITKVEGNTIVNETNNTVYNPVTNTTSNITDWQYDYSTRTYNLTLDNGTTSTVTYGDENITIIEGDTTYNVYYLVETPSPDTCNHSWTETSATPATCTVPGSRLLTCSLCNETKTETIPAPGHTWQIKQTVQTQYDDTGQLAQQGYTIFEYSVCHEQYKSEDGTAPPGGGSGTDPGGEGESLWDKLGSLIGSGLGGILGLVEAVIGKLLDALIVLVDMLMGKLKTVVEAVLSIFDQLPALFGGFLDFLAAVFPFLPPELMTILTFGVIAIATIGIIKAVRR